MRFRVSVAVLVLVIAGGGLRALAQDRIILFEPFIQPVDSQPRLPGQIREIEIGEGGRSLSEVVRVGLPAHKVRGKPVALADGRKIMWLADDDGGASLLAQYDRTTYRASIVDVGHFSRAFLIADKPRARVFVIEPTRVTALDEALRPFSVDFAGPAEIAGAAAGGDILVLWRREQFRAADMLILNSRTGQTIRTVAVNALATSSMQAIVSADGKRLYRAYTISFQDWLELISIETGEVLARVPNARPGYTFELDDSRGVLITDQAEHLGPRVVFQVRDARTLALVSEFGLGLFSFIYELQHALTREAFVVYHSEGVTPYMDESCRFRLPRLTMVDSRTYTPVRQIDLQGHCPYLVQLPAR